MSRHLHAPDELPVTFRYRPDGPVFFVDLRGDLVHWSHIEPMTPGREGWFEATLRLGPGAYGYKVQLSGSEDWRLDPQNPRTRARDGIRNSLLVVGGADEPLIHVPARPWVFLRRRRPPLPPGRAAPGRRGAPRDPLGRRGWPA